MNWQLDAEPKPAILVLPPAAASLDEAHAAIELWEHYSRKTLDPTQRLTVEVMMAETAEGKWAASTTGREMPRQNGKGDELEVVELWGLVQRAEAILHTIHDAVLLATQTQQRMLALLEHPDLRRKVKRKWQGTGQQMIEMRNGGIIWYRTRTGGGGRGVDDISRLVVDEAQHATEEHLAAITPTLLANSNPQLNIAGTSALEGHSAWWWRIRRRALSESPGAFGYVGHTAEVVYLDDQGNIVQDPVDVADRRLWSATNPALSAGRGGGMEFLEEQLLRLGEEAFAGEHLGVWDPPPSDRVTVAKIPAGDWAATATPRSLVPAVSPGEMTLAWGVSLDGQWSSIGIGIGTLTASYVELIEHRRGTLWLADRLVELVDAWDPIVVGSNGAGATAAHFANVLVAFRDAGISSDLLVQLRSSEWKAACGGFLIAVVEGQVAHVADGQAPLDLAVENASERRLGDGFAWDARATSVPLSPLDVVTAARALLPTEPQPKPYDVLASVF